MVPTLTKQVVSVLLKHVIGTRPVVTVGVNKRQPFLPAETIFAKVVRQRVVRTTVVATLPVLPDSIGTLLQAVAQVIVCLQQVAPFVPVGNIGMAQLASQILPPAQIHRQVAPKLVAHGILQRVIVKCQI